MLFSKGLNPFNMEKGLLRKLINFNPTKNSIAASRCLLMHPEYNVPNVVVLICELR